VRHYDGKVVPDKTRLAGRFFGSQSRRLKARGRHGSLGSRARLGIDYAVTSRSHRRGRSCSRFSAFGYPSTEGLGQTRSFRILSRKKTEDTLNDLVATACGRLMTDWHYLFGLNGPQGRSYNADVNTRFKQRPLRMTASGHLRWSLLFQENCLVLGEPDQREGSNRISRSRCLRSCLAAPYCTRPPTIPHSGDSVEEYAIYLLDPNGNVITWNTGAAKIKGYSTEEIIGKTSPPSIQQTTLPPVNRNAICAKRAVADTFVIRVCESEKTGQLSKRRLSLLRFMMTPGTFAVSRK